MKNEKRTWEIAICDDDIEDMKAGNKIHWGKRINGELYTIVGTYHGWN